jgi:hypothetical protein
MPPLPPQGSASVSAELLAERIVHAREIAALNDQLRDKALELQALETARRLELLNNESGRIAKSAAEHVSSEKFDLKVGPIEQRVGNIEIWKANLDGRILGIAFTCAAITSGVGLLIAWLAMRGR